ILSVIFCNGVMKNLVQRDRPFWTDEGLLAQIEAMKASVPSWLHVVIPTDFSFPSGHTSASFAAAVAIFMMHKKEGIAAIVVAALISLSRLYIGVHFPTDVLVSLVLGTIYGIVAVLIVKFVLKKINEKRGEVKENA
ncbi:MAG: phosphatase PAP2 family protein, partial [Lachnospiraceae bacterium]